MAHKQEEVVVLGATLDGALRVRLVAAKNGGGALFPLQNAAGEYVPGVILDLDAWVILPR